MGLFDFLKKKEVKVEEEKVSFNKLESWIKEKESENKEIENNILKDVKDRISLFTDELDKNIEILRNVDVDEKKAEVRIKNIVRTALHTYLDQLKKLKNDLLETQSIEEVTATLHEFENKTIKTYQKTTFLIGKEMGNVKTSFQTLYKFLNDIEDKELSKTKQTITTIKQSLTEIKDVEKDVENLKEQENEIENELNTLKEKEKQITQEIENIKQSQEHLNNLKKIEEKELDKESLKQLIQELRPLIDFKKLTSVFHSSENMMNKIKQYKSSFSDAIEDQNTLLELLDEANLNNEEIKNKLKQITDLKQKIESTKIQENKTKSLEPKLKDIQEKINKINPKENKRHVKHTQRKEEIIQTMKQELKKVNINLRK